MNERIRELAVNNERIMTFFETGPVQRAAIEDFARAIVRECAWMIDINRESRADLSGKDLKQYFGVEE